jgi:hypothetical protein
LIAVRSRLFAAGAALPPLIARNAGFAAERRELADVFVALLSFGKSMLPLVSAETKAYTFPLIGETPAKRRLDLMRAQPYHAHPEASTASIGLPCLRTAPTALKRPLHAQ